ncbi:MAG: 50S ribosomal protein L21 [Planctomycetota bacterium]
MYAVLEQGSKQYLVSEGDSLDIELTEVAPDADSVVLDKVLFIADGEKVQIGTPYVEGARIVARFQTSAEDSVVRGPKIYPAYRRRRKNSQKRIGHRQSFLHVIVEKIEV